MHSPSAPTHASEFWSTTNWLPHIAPKDTHISCLNITPRSGRCRSPATIIPASTGATIITTTIVMASMMAMPTMFIIVIKLGAPMPRLRLGRYLRFYWPDICTWLRNQGNNHRP
jgi:hypothetical protein